MFATEKLEFEQIRQWLIPLAHTPEGALLLEKLAPSADEQVVDRRCRRSSEMLQLLDAGETPPFERLPSISDAIKKARIQRYVLDGTTLRLIGRWLAMGRLLATFFSRNAEQAPELANLASGIVPAKELEKRINHTIDDTGQVHRNASDTLAQLYRKTQQNRERARQKLQSILKTANEAGMTADEEVTIRDGRLVIPVKAEYKRRIKGFIHGTSATGQTVFLEPVEVFDLNNEVRELESALEQEIQRILAELTAEVAAYADLVDELIRHTARLDAAYAVVLLGRRWKGIVPGRSTAGRLQLAQARNPLLMQKHTRYDEAVRRVVPLDLQLEPSERGLMITGPNAGGKSVVLKTLGLAMLMTASGIPIPAREDSMVPVVPGLYVDMGDDQSIENDLSTFSSRLAWMREVLQHASAGSFILVDEAGSGTDPEEGTALARAFLEQVMDKGAVVVVTTHHGDLKVFAHDTPGWINASMEFNRQTLSPTYRLVKGVPGSSYAFEMARRMHLPQTLIDRAREQVGSEKNRMEQLIIDLENKRSRAQDELHALRKQKASASERYEQLSQRLDRLRSQQDQIREDGRRQAKELLASSNRLIEQAIRAATTKDQKQLAEKRKEIADLSAHVDRQERRRARKRRPQQTSSRKPVVGDHVRLSDSNTAGELLETSGSKATVMVGGLRITTSLGNLTLADKQHAPPGISGYRRSPGSATEAMPFAGSLDIRGKRGEESVQLVMRFVDEGLSRGLHRLSIVHGKGDGILRRLVHEHLASRKDVSRFEIAPIEEGGEGCTYVYL